MPRDPVVTAPRTARRAGRTPEAGRGIARSEVVDAVDDGVTGGVDRTDGGEDALVSANAANTPVLAKNKFMPTAPCTWCKTVRYSPRHRRALQAGGGRPDSQYIIYGVFTRVDEPERGQPTSNTRGPRDRYSVRPNTLRGESSSLADSRGLVGKILKFRCVWRIARCDRQRERPVPESSLLAGRDRLSQMSFRRR